MHTITYQNAPSSWNEALPLGNGHFGGMMFFEENRLTLAMNHYEVYYRKLHRYSRAYRDGEGRRFDRQYGFTFDELKRRASDMYRNPDEGPFYLYGDAFTSNNMYRKYGKPSGGTSHYPTGELWLMPSAELADPESYTLRLDIEQAHVDLHIENGEQSLHVRSLVAQKGDYVVTQIEQSKGGLLEAAALTVPMRRYTDMKVNYNKLDDTTFYYTGSFYPDGEDKERYDPFTFLVMTKLIGAKGEAEATSDAVHIRLRDAGEHVTMVTTVVTDEEAQDLLEAAKQRLSKSSADWTAITTHHRLHWERFWKRSSVTLPDKMLEDLWYVNLYAIACSSGKNGRMFEQACGLNGLWDIKQPTKWGSMWYWDVNIQAAFWPLYTANHLETAEAFNDGLLSYAAEAERMANQFYGLEGYAADYPHALYLSIWPWCAQFLWDYYRYSMDLRFLREKAYPAFKRIVKFFEGYLQYDPVKGQYDVFPDISPEQGPITRNSVSTLSTVKYLLKLTIEANALLGEEKADRDKWSEMAARLAPYPTAVSARYGDVFKDSEWAPADLHLRHPSLLMPIYPIGEIDKNSEESLRQRAENTLRHAERHTEYGMFQFGWLSAAASRLGKGNTALRLLYEQGIDLSLRSNGLFAEETERWMNYCNITNEPLYHPHMIEASGETVAAVNEMLLQSYSGMIEVFPAVPTGEPEPERTIGMYEHDVLKKVRTYPKWDDCAFQGLLAVGAFEVSASMSKGRTAWIKIKSLAGARAVVRNPFAQSDRLVVSRLGGAGWMPSDYTLENGMLVFDTEVNGEYAIHLDSEAASSLSIKQDCRTSSPQTAQRNGGQAGFDYPRVHEAHTSRKVFLGKNRDTGYLKLLDHFTFDYYSGNYRESRLAAYRLDFGVSVVLLNKDYSQALPRQVHMDQGVIGQAFRKITAETVFTPYSGIGWESAEGLSAEDGGGPDLLRRDFIGGTDEKTFLLELPRGRYDVLLVSGDDGAPSYTEIEIEGQGVWTPDRVLKAGEYAAEIMPVSQRKDGYAKFRFRTREGLKWKINLMIVNKNYTYL
ncbi:glycosyl hydrolase family 95 catalytic domain-containing protein [Paenibacillus contaminans]|uniref:Sugar phosphorylase n=1 Tax=Paenibacillus contaminans TaxID=450362 RepID=A0A329MN90_9BACL|nr:glycoside hydrolase N-terminal domain-containing protein [Paenibacillus contaminans]RAV20938.1 sugar phosphorylase [Paenibacillus contaminans]